MTFNGHARAVQNANSRCRGASNHRLYDLASVVPSYIYCSDIFSIIQTLPLLYLNYEKQLRSARLVPFRSPPSTLSTPRIRTTATTTPPASPTCVPQSSSTSSSSSPPVCSLTSRPINGGASTAKAAPSAAAGCTAARATCTATATEA